MKRKISALIILVISVIAIFALASCGGSDNSGTPCAEGEHTYEVFFQHDEHCTDKFWSAVERYGFKGMNGEDYRVWASNFQPERDPISYTPEFATQVHYYPKHIALCTRCGWLEMKEHSLVSVEGEEAPYGYHNVVCENCEYTHEAKCDTESDSCFCGKVEPAVYFEYDSFYNYLAVITEDATGDIVIPATYDGKTVAGVKLAQGVSFESIEITSLSVPSRAINFYNGLSIQNNSTIKSITVTFSEFDQQYLQPAELYLGNLSALEEVTVLGEVSAVTIENCAALTTVDTGSFARVKFDNCPALTSVSVKSFHYIESDDGEIPEGLTEVTIYEIYHMLYENKLPSSVKTLNISETCTEIGDNVFNRSSLETVNAPGLTKIGRDTFYGCINLKTISAPNLTSVGVSAFEGCIALENITLNKLTDIGTSAFNRCESIKSADLSSAESIGIYAFAWCTALESVTLSDDLTTVSSGLFSCCSSLSEITIPGEATELYTSAFSGCGAITIRINEINFNEEWTSFALDFGNENNDSLRATIVFGKDITEIPDNFIWGTCVVGIEFEEGSRLESIGDEAFVHTGISTITLPSTVESVGNLVFRDSPSLEQISYSESLYIPYNAIENCESYEYEEYQGGYYFGKTLVGIKEGTVDLSIREGTKYLAKVANLMNAYGSLKTVVMPNTVEEILSTQMFMGYGSLESVTLSTSLKKIPSAMFSYCTSLKEITIPESIEVIDGAAFMESGLASITVPASVTEIGDMAFHNCTSLSTVTFSGESTLTKIGEQAFYRNAFSAITIPASVTEVGERAFKGCASLTTVDLLGEDTTIPESAFDGCRSFKGIVYFNGYYKGTTFVGMVDATKTFLYIKPGTTKIAAGAFSDNTAVKNVYIPESVTDITANEFASCTGVRLWFGGRRITGLGVSYPQDMSDINRTVNSDGWMYEVLSSGVMIEGYLGEETEIVIPTFLEETIVNVIGKSAFAGNTRITSVEIGYGVVDIHGGAFMNCTSLETVTISETLYMLNNMVFSGCTALESVTIAGDGEFSIYGLGDTPGNNTPETTVSPTDSSLITKLTSTYSNYLWVRGLDFSQ